LIRQAAILLANRNADHRIEFSAGAQGITFEGRNLTLSEYLEEWITFKKNVVRPKTAFQYQRLINKYISPTLGKIQLKDLNLRLISRFYVVLLDKGVGVYNVNYAHRVLHNALTQAVKNGLIGRNPAHGATVPKPKRKEMQILNEQQVGLFLVAASQSRYKALYHLAVTTGMRFSELRGLSWSAVDWINGAITVNKQIQDVPRHGALSGPTKTHAGNRIIRLGETTLNELREQKKSVEAEKSMAGEHWQENDLVFPSKKGTPFSSKHLRDNFASVLEAANLPKIRFHDLRHTAASLMLNRSVPALVVSKILGHANPSVTLSIYAHATLDMQSQAVSIMDEIVTPISVQLHPIAPAEKIAK
jgi:integrase